METVDDLENRDKTLSVQLRLALASPLWRCLPHEARINPREWQLEILELRPGRRLCVRALIPWQPSHNGRAPLEFLLVTWPGGRARGVHGLFTRRLRCEGNQPQGARAIFYDALSHSLVCQLHPAARRAAAPLDARGATRIVVKFISGLRGQARPPKMAHA